MTSARGAGLTWRLTGAAADPPGVARLKPRRVCREERGKGWRLTPRRAATRGNRLRPLDLPAPASCFCSSVCRPRSLRGAVDAFLQRQRQAQHAVSVQGAEFLDVEELRDCECFWSRETFLSRSSLGYSARMVRLFPATSRETSSGSMPGSGTSTRQPSSVVVTWNDGDEPAAVRSVDAPELVEEPIYLPLKIEHLIERIPTGQPNIVNLLLLFRTRGL